MIPLGLLANGEKATVTKAPLHSSHEQENPATRMGLGVGSTIMILKNEGRSPLLVKVENSRIALDRSLAMKILVTKE